jgi:hypothetical protein
MATLFFYPHLFNLTLSLRNSLFPDTNVRNSIAINAFGQKSLSSFQIILLNAIPEIEFQRLRVTNIFKGLQLHARFFPYRPETQYSSLLH